jgi:hypothetical protein
VLGPGAVSWHGKAASRSEEFVNVFVCVNACAFGTIASALRMCAWQQHEWLATDVCEGMHGSLPAHMHMHAGWGVGVSTARAGYRDACV